MGKDSNLRSDNAADLQSAPFGRLGHPSSCCGRAVSWSGARADGGSRTRNRLITNQVLCQLSYASLGLFECVSPVWVGPVGKLDAPRRGSNGRAV